MDLHPAGNAHLVLGSFLLAARELRRAKGAHRPHGRYTDRTVEIADSRLQA